MLDLKRVVLWIVSIFCCLQVEANFIIDAFGASRQSAGHWNSYGDYLPTAVFSDSVVQIWFGELQPWHEPANYAWNGREWVEVPQALALPSADVIDSSIGGNVNVAPGCPNEYRAYIEYDNGSRARMDIVEWECPHVKGVIEGGALTLLADEVNEKTEVELKVVFKFHNGTTWVNLTKTKLITIWPSDQSVLPVVSASKDSAGNVVVSISSQTPNAGIYFTLDGSNPVYDEALRYSSPLVIGRGCTLRAQTGRKGALFGSVVEKEIDPSDIEQSAEEYSSFTQRKDGIFIDWTRWESADGWRPAGVKYYVYGEKAYRPADECLIDGNTTGSGLISAEDITSNDRFYIWSTWNGGSDYHGYHGQKYFTLNWRPIRPAKTSIDFLPDGGRYKLTVTDAESCKVVFDDEETAAWVKADPNPDGFDISVTPNATSSEREAYFWIKREPLNDTAWAPVKVYVKQRENSFLAPVENLDRGKTYIANQCLVLWDAPGSSTYGDIKGLSYLVYRSQGRDAEKVFLAETTEQFYSDKTAVPETKYWYWVQAKEGERRSEICGVETFRCKKVLPEKVSLPKWGTSQLFTINCDGYWEVSCSNEWSFFETSFGYGAGEVRVKALESDKPYTRSDYIGIRYQIEQGVWGCDFVEVSQAGFAKDIREIQIDGSDKAVSGKPQQYSCYALYEDGTRVKIDPGASTLNGYSGPGANFYLVEAPNGSYLTKQGLFTAGQVDDVTNAAIGVWYEEWGVTNVATKAVAVWPSDDYASAADCNLTFETQGNEWEVVSDDVYAGVYSIRNGTPKGSNTRSVLSTTANAGVLSFWCKLSPEFKSLGGIYGQYLQVQVGGTTVKKLFYEDAADWTQIKLVIPEDGSVVSWLYQYVGSNEPYGVARIDKIALEVAKVSDIYIDGKDSFDYVRNMNPAGYVLGYYGCMAHMNGIMDSAVAVSNCLWSIKGDNAEIMGSNYGAECKVSVKTTDTDERFTLVVIYDDGEVRLQAEKQISVAYDFVPTLDNTSLDFTQTGSKGWGGVYSVHKVGNSSAKNGGLKAGQTTSIQTSVSGERYVMFWWKSELPEIQDVCFECLVDGVSMVKIQGVKDWRKETVRIPAGSHQVEWRHSNSSGVDEAIEAAVFLDGVSTVENAATVTTPISVEFSWLDQYSGLLESYGGDYELLANAKTGKKDLGGNDMFVWQDYVAGTDPTDPDDLLQIELKMVDGVPNVSWKPDLNKNGVKRTYKVMGRAELGSGGWEWPSDALRHRFFKVSVDMLDDKGTTDVPGLIEAWRLIAMPTAVNGLSYDGEVKQGVLSGSGYTLYNASAADAGNYIASVILEGGYKWMDGSRADLQIQWSIAKTDNAWLSVPSMSATSFLAGSVITVTDGASKFGTVTRNYSDSMIQSLPAGSYTLISTVSETANYTGLMHSIPFTVTGPTTKIALPSAKTGLAYTGSMQIGVASGTGYTLSGNTAINAGSYTATATLKSGYEWSDGSPLQERTISWSIAKATNSWLTQPSLSSTEFSQGTTVTLSLGTVKFGVRQANYTAAELAQLPVGSYTLEVSVAGTDNYTGLTKSIPFVVTEASDAVTGIRVYPTSITLNGVGETYQLEATVLPATASNKAVTWSTSDPSVAVVDKGMVTTVGLGNATITATTQEGGYSRGCSVSVASVCISNGEDSDISNIKLYSGSSSTRSGNGAWFEQSSQVYAGSKALRTGNRVERSSDSYFGSVVYGSGTISFWWKVSSSTYDRLRFYVGADYKAEIYGVGQGWQYVSLRLEGAWSHQIRWSYNNLNPSFAKAGDDCGWVDCIEWKPDEETSDPPTRIEISGSPIVAAQESSTYSATIYFQNGAAASTSSFNTIQFGTCAILPIWSVEETDTAATINPYSGMMSANGAVGNVTIRATYTANGVTVVGSKTVQISK